MNDTLVRFDNQLFNGEDDHLTLKPTDLNAILYLRHKFNVPVFFDDRNLHGTTIDMPRIRIELQQNGEFLDPFFCIYQSNGSGIEEELLLGVPVKDGAAIMHTLAECTSPF